MPSLLQKYQKEIRNRFDWEDIVERAQMTRLDGAYSYVYLDTMFSLMPSYGNYPPRESSEYEPCLQCQGSKKTKSGDAICKLCGGLGSYNAYKDQQYWSALEQVADSYGLWVARGEEDRFSVFAGIKLDVSSARH
ncbi:hypothetical protein MJD09_08905 [bacterium]|nr:hypothetical protein [bacterium]